MPRIVEVFGEQVRVHQVVDGMTLNKFAELTYPEYNNFPVPVLATQKKYDVVHPVKNEDLQIVFRDQWDTPLVRMGLGFTCIYRCSVAPRWPYGHTTAQNTRLWWCIG